MPRYKVISLVDITESGATKSDNDLRRQGQQSNFNTLVQTIGLRSNVSWSQTPKKTDGTLPNPFLGRGTYWTWIFEVEKESVFEKDGNPVALLNEDVNGVPIIVGLDDTCNIDPRVFVTSGDTQNLYIEEI